MQTLPIDTIDHVATYLSMKELATIAQTHRDFNLPRQYRRGRFEWCCEKTDKQRHIRHGQCVIARCRRQKASCIHLDPRWRSIFEEGQEPLKPLARQTLSHYCSIHATLHIGIDLLKLL